MRKTSKTRRFFLSLGVMLLTAAMTAGVSAIFIYTMEKVSVEQTEARQEVRRESAPSGKQPPSGAMLVDAKPAEPVYEKAALDDTLVLVNFEHALPDSFHRNIIDLYGTDVDERLEEPFKQMQRAARADGVSLWISSGYRSVARQEELFTRAVSENLDKGMDQKEAEAVAAVSVARPGWSEHNTGLAIDLNGVAENFDTMPEFAWLDEHAVEYGFILRYPKDKQEITGIRYEPWHYRYVGTEHAKAIRERHFCLEEYVDYLEDNR